MTEAVDAAFDESAERALLFFHLHPDDTDGIEEQLRLMFVYVDDDTQYSWETRDALHTGLVSAFKAAVRTERDAEIARLVAWVRGHELPHYGEPEGLTNCEKNTYRYPMTDAELAPCVGEPYGPLPDAVCTCGADEENAELRAALAPFTEKPE